VLEALQNFNEKRWKSNQTVIRIGIGIHIGFQILGIIGDQQRLEGTVISDAVNTAVRLEGLTKIFGTELLISEQALLSSEWFLCPLPRGKHQSISSVIPLIAPYLFWSFGAMIGYKTFGWPVNSLYYSFANSRSGRRCLDSLSETVAWCFHP